MTECDQAHNTILRILVDLSINVVFHIDIYFILHYCLCFLCYYGEQFLKIDLLFFISKLYN